MKKLFLIFIPAILLFLGVSCIHEPAEPGIDHPKDNPDTVGIPADWNYAPEAMKLNRPYSRFAPVEVPGENPQTVQGFELGRMLFYDPILSKDSTVSCSSCHKQSHSFSDEFDISPGVNGSKGKRNAMALINLVYNHKEFNWHGNAPSIEEQALFPVTHPQEMQENWDNVVLKLQRHPDYPKYFYEAFGKNRIDQTQVTKALAQFIRSLISGNSKFDKFQRGELRLSKQEMDGYIKIFFTEKGDCFHCHSGILFTDNLFRNNGLDSAEDVFDFRDIGRGEITGLKADYGKFRTPTLRNVELTAPYMHDGRFKTLEEVIEHYNSGGHPSPTVDPNMKNVGEGLKLTNEEKQSLLAFLKTLTDTSFINNPNFSNPFK